MTVLSLWFTRSCISDLEVLAGHKTGTMSKIETAGQDIISGYRVNP